MRAYSEIVEFSPHDPTARQLLGDIHLALAQRMGVDSAFARSAVAAYVDAVEAGYGEDDDAVLVKPGS